MSDEATWLQHYSPNETHFVWWPDADPADIRGWTVMGTRRVLSPLEVLV